MNTFLIVGVILVAILVIWLALQSIQSREKSGTIESQMNELRRDLQTIATSQASSTGQLETIAKSVAQRLDSVGPALQEAIIQDMDRPEKALRQHLKQLKLST